MARWSRGRYALEAKGLEARHTNPAQGGTPPASMLLISLLFRTFYVSHTKRQKRLLRKAPFSK